MDAGCHPALHWLQRKLFQKFPAERPERPPTKGRLASLLFSFSSSDALHCVDSSLEPLSSDISMKCAIFLAANTQASSSHHKQPSIYAKRGLGTHRVPSEL